MKSWSNDSNLWPVLIFVRQGRAVRISTDISSPHNDPCPSISGDQHLPPSAQMLAARGATQFSAPARGRSLQASTSRSAAAAAVRRPVRSRQVQASSPASGLRCVCSLGTGKNSSGESTESPKTVAAFAVGGWGGAGVLSFLFSAGRQVLWPSRRSIAHLPLTKDAHARILRHHP